MSIKNFGEISRNEVPALVFSGDQNFLTTFLEHMWTVKNGSPLPV